MSKKLVWLFIFSFILSLLFATQAEAAQFITGERIAIDKKTHDNLYLFGNSIDIDEPIAGDLVVFGNSVNINHNVQGDVIVAANTINITSNIGGSLRAAGANIFFDGKVGQDFLTAGNSIRISSNSLIKKDLLLAVNNASIDGSVKKQIRGGANSMAVNGVVGKNLLVNVNRLVIGSKAKIKGNLSYTSLNKALISKNAKIKGSVNHIVPSREVVYGQISSWLRSLLGMLLVALLVAAIIPDSFKAVRETLIDKPWASPALGFALLVLMPFFIIFAFVTIIGLPLGLIMLTLYLAALYFSQIYVAWVIGSYIMQRIIPGRELAVANALIGVTFLAIIRLLPLFGPLATLLIIIFGFGALTLTLISQWQQRATPVNH